MTLLAETVTLAPAIQAVSKYLEKHRAELAPEQIQICFEIQRRLDRLAAQAAELISINNRLWAKQGLQVDFDQGTDTITFSLGGVEQRVKLNRADPSVPIQVKDLTAGSAYHATTSKAADGEEQRLRFELEERLESYYQSAHRVLKLFGRISGLKGIKCVAVSRVRNELIEHAGDGALYSFGTGATGPRVKPMYQSAQQFNDEGLVPNTQAFVDSIVAGCAGNAS